MALGIDSRKIVQAKLVPWETGLFGIAWEATDGLKGADLIGTKMEAQTVLRWKASSQSEPTPDIAPAR